MMMMIFMIECVFVSLLFLLIYQWIPILMMSRDAGTAHCKVV